MSARGADAHRCQRSEQPDRFEQHAGAEHQGKNHGAELAKRWCASCHLVDASQKHASTDARPFDNIAHQSDFTPEKVAFFLLDPTPEDAEFSVEPERGGRSRRLHRLAVQIIRRAAESSEIRRQMQTPAGDSRQGSAEKSTDGERVHPVARQGPAR
jgi:hypothetical protein